MGIIKVNNKLSNNAKAGSLVWVCLVLIIIKMAAEKTKNNIK
jgi:hypothetical protein